MSNLNIQISKKTIHQIQGFLFDIFKEIGNYRSLHSLTEQMTHDYYGRFIIELLQNAHDAHPTYSKKGTIKINGISDHDPF